MVRFSALEGERDTQETATDESYDASLLRFRPQS